MEEQSRVLSLVFLDHHMQQGEIDLIRAVRIGRMNFRLDAGRVVEQNIENKMAFVFVRSDDTGVDGNMVRHQRV